MYTVVVMNPWLAEDPDVLEQSMAIARDEVFNGLYKEHYLPMLRFAQQWLSSGEEAADVVHDCFLKLWKGHTPPYPVHSWRNYLFTMVRHRCHDVVKHKRRNNRIEKNWRQLQPTEDPPKESDILLRENIQQVMHALEQLPARMQEVFRLYYLEEKTYSEIAALYKTRPGTVRNQRVKAVAALQKILSSAHTKAAKKDPL